jgi:ATP-dependent protease ClpP protease subunit
MAEALLYGSINDYTAEIFVNRIAEISAMDSESLEVLINSNGGNPEATWGGVGMFSAFTGDKSVAIHGKAYSMGLFYAMYAPKENVSCLDVSQGLLHRAAYGEWFESSEYFTEDLKANLANINAKLMEATKNRIDVAALESIMAKQKGLEGKKFKDIWAMDTRINVMLTAKNLKEIGLVGKIIKITPSKTASINASIQQCAASYNGGVEDMLLPVAQVAEPIPTPEAEKTTTNKVMTKEDFQAQHPEAYKAIVVGAQAQERSRVMAWMKFNNIDAEAVKAGVESGDSLMDKQEVFADLIVKFNDPNRAANAAAEAAKATPTTVTADNGADNGGGGELSEVEAAAAAVKGILNPEKV